MRLLCRASPLDFPHLTCAETLLLIPAKHDLCRLWSITMHLSYLDMPRRSPRPCLLVFASWRTNTTVPFNLTSDKAGSHSAFASLQKGAPFYERLPRLCAHRKKAIKTISRKSRTLATHASCSRTQHVASTSRSFLQQRRKSAT